MYTGIKLIMQEHCSHIKLDNQLANKLAGFRRRFINENEDHVSFFGSNLMGVYRVRFSNMHRLELTEEIFNIDDLAIQKQVRALPNIGSDWIRGTDGLNLALLYLVHLLAIDTKLSAKARFTMQVDLLLILQYKFMSSWMNYSFKYLVSKEVAVAVYNSLSGKYLIKKYKTWQGVLEYRSQDILLNSPSHKNTILTFTDDNAVQYLVTTIQSQIKSMIINLYGVTLDVIEQDNKLRTSSALISLDGEVVLKDVVRERNNYLNYIKTVSPNAREFIKLDLVEIIDSTITTLPKKLFLDTLVHHSAQCSNSASDSIVLTEEVIFHCFTFFSENPKVVPDLKDLALVIKTIKDLYTAGKSADPSVLKSRKIGEKIAKKATSTKSAVTISALRTGLILYILLRTLTKDHYG